MRALLLIVILAMLSVSSGAEAAGPWRGHGGGSSGVACPYINGQTVNDCITPATTNYLYATIGSLVPNWNFPTLSVNTLEDHNSGGTYAATKAILCNSAVYYGSVSWLSSTSFGGYYPWISEPGYSQINQNSGSCATTLAYFLNNTTNGTCITSSPECFNPGSLSANATNGDSIEIKAPPAGIPCWIDVTGNGEGAVTINSNSVTLTFDAGACIEYSSDYYSHGAVVVNGTGATINGGLFAYIPTNTNVSCWRVNNGAVNTTIENGTCHNSDTCLLTGDAGVGYVVLLNITAYDCGGDGGQDHIVYVGANTAGDNNAYVSGTNLNLYDVVNGGWNFKARPLGINTQNHLIDSLIGCRNQDETCEQNGAVGPSCGGNWLIDYNTIETHNPDNFYQMRFADEQNQTGCPITVNLTVSVSNSTTLTSSTNPRTLGFEPGDTIWDNASGGCGGLGGNATTLISITGPGPYTLTLGTTDTAVSGSCLIQRTGALQVTGTETSGNNTISGLAYSPASLNIYNGYGVSGTGIQTGSSIASSTSTSITLTCPSSPCVTSNGSQTLLVGILTSVVSNYDTFVQDGNGGLVNIFAALCLGKTSGPTACAGVGAQGAAIMLSQLCIENSVFVQDPAATQPLVAGTGVTDCGPGGNSNTTYASRTTANTALMWCGGGSGSCSTWANLPIPPHLTQDFRPDHDTQVAMAHAAGLCGEGTQADPIDFCAGMVANDNLIRVASNGNEVWTAPRRVVDYYPFARNGGAR